MWVTIDFGVNKTRPAGFKNFMNFYRSENVIIRFLFLGLGN